MCIANSLSEASYSDTGRHAIKQILFPTNDGNQIRNTGISLNKQNYSSVRLLAQDYDETSVMFYVTILDRAATLVDNLK
jgi:hypothetical protein